MIQEVKIRGDEGDTDIFFVSTAIQRHRSRVREQSFVCIDKRYSFETCKSGMDMHLYTFTDMYTRIHDRYE